MVLNPTGIVMTAWPCNLPEVSMTVHGCAGGHYPHQAGAVRQTGQAHTLITELGVESFSACSLKCHAGNNPVAQSRGCEIGSLLGASAFDKMQCLHVPATAAFRQAKLLFQILCCRFVLTATLSCLSVCLRVLCLQSKACQVFCTGTLEQGGQVGSETGNCAFLHCLLPQDRNATTLASGASRGCVFV